MIICKVCGYIYLHLYDHAKTTYEIEHNNNELKEAKEAGIDTELYLSTYPNEWDRKPFLTSMDDITFDNHISNQFNLSKHIIYACPKCGTLKIEV